MFMPHIGPMELGLVLLLVMIVFGVGKLPQVGGALGKGIREFRKAQTGEGETTAEASEASETTEAKTKENS